MDGEQFVSILTKEFGLHLSAVTKNQWKGKKAISAIILRNAFKKFERQRLTQAIEPIVEFHRLNFEHNNKNVDTFAKRVDDKRVLEELKGTPGIYAFFIRGGDLVYVGKTEKSNLLQEMNQRYLTKKVPFRVIKNGKACREDARIRDVADYFSAYKVDQHLIKNVEALLTRIIINNASNLRIESFTKRNI
jgi:hypothetical protein